MKEKIEIFKLEDRVLFEAAAVAEIVEAMENDPNANMNENDRQAQEEKDAIKNAPVENATVQGAQPDLSNPSDKSGIDAEIQALIEGEIGFSDAANNAVSDLLNEFGANAVEDVIHDAFAEKETGAITVDASEAADYELVVINSSVQDKDQIISTLAENQEVLTLENGRDAMDQINDYLDASGKEYSAIHIVSHGNDGYITLAGERYDASNFELADWVSIGSHLTDGGDILLYGCNLTGGEAGQDFVAMIADASGADVAASTNATGLNGDWVLEYSNGTIETAAITVESYDYSLVPIQISVSDDASLRNAFTEIDNGADLEYELSFDLDANAVISLTGGELNILQRSGLTITIDGKVANETRLTIDADGNSRIFNFGTDNAVIIKNLIMSNGKATAGGGGAIAHDGSTLTIDNSAFYNNMSELNGGAICTSDRTTEVTVTNSTFDNNIALGSGGAILTHNALDVDNVEFNNNRSYMFGGAIIGYSDITVKNSAFTNNTAVNGGGAIFKPSDVGNVEVLNSTFTNNTVSSGNGGAIHVWKSLTVTGSTFTDNTASQNGGAICVYDDLSKSDNAVASITNSTFMNNAATNGDGGAVYVWGSPSASDQSTLGVSGGTFTNNTALKGNGGAIYANAGLTVDASSVFGNATDDTKGNSARNGGAIYIDSGASSASISGKYYSNEASNGGAIYSKALLSIDGATFEDNYASVGGGAVYYTNSAQLVITDSDFIDNTTGAYGGAIYIRPTSGVANLSLSEVSISGGNATQGGAVYMFGTGFILTMDDVTVENCTVGTGRGGAIYAEGTQIDSTVDISNSSFTNLNAGGGAGLYLKTSHNTVRAAIDVTLDSVIFDTSTTTGTVTLGAAVYIVSDGDTSIGITGKSSFVNCTADYGGAIHLQSVYGAAVFTATGTAADRILFKDNLALTNVGMGGAVYINGKTKMELDIAYVDFKGNKGYSGSAIHMNSVPDEVVVRVDNCSFTDNISNDHGNVATRGALYIGSHSAIDAVISNSVFSGNQSLGTGYGGAVSLYSHVVSDDVTLVLDNVKFTDNVSGSLGGAVYLQGKEGNTANLIVKGDSLFDGNSAVNGGAIYSYYYNVLVGVDILGVATAGSASFTGNSASNRGGAIYTNAGLTVSDAVFGSATDSSKGNSALNGGAIYVALSTATVSIGGEFYDNKATTGNGGAIYLSNGGTISNATFGRIDGSGVRSGGNYAKLDGGAIYAAGGTTYIKSDAGANFFYCSEAGRDGGLIYVAVGATVDIRSDVENGSAADMTFGGGTAGRNGGAIYSAGVLKFDETTTDQNGSLTYKLDNKYTFTDNKALGDGGALYLAKGSKIFQGGELNGYRDENEDVNMDEIRYLYGENAKMWFEGNSAGNNGGAIYNGIEVVEENRGHGTGTYYWGTYLRISRSTFVKNEAGNDGGAIYSDSNALLYILADVTFRENKAGNDGGAVYAGDFLTLCRTTNLVGGVEVDCKLYFNDNEAGRNGGAMYVTAEFWSLSDAMFSEAIFDGNKALEGSGGGLYVEGNLLWFRSTFTNNTADKGNGGGLYVGGDFEAWNPITCGEKGQDKGNSAINGGGIYVNGYFDGMLASFYGNNATQDGGGLYVNAQDSGGIVHIKEGTYIDLSLYFEDNHADRDGGAIFVNNGLLEISGGWNPVLAFINNTAGNNGGAVYANDKLEITSSGYLSFQGNTAEKSGGAVYAVGDATIKGGTFSNNTAKTGDGGAIFAAGNADITDSTFTGNFVKHTNSDTSTRGGAVYAAGNLTLGGSVEFKGNYIEVNPVSNTSTGVTEYLQGGAVYVGGNLTHTGSVLFDGNYIKSVATTYNGDKILAMQGGALYVAGTTEINGVKFENNYIDSEIAYNFATATGDVRSEGGALYTAGKATLNNVTFNGNYLNSTAGTNLHGGAYYAAGILAMTGGSFSNNWVEGTPTLDSHGGALYVSGSGSISGVEFLENKSNPVGASNASGQGGALYLSATGVLTVDGSKFNKNRARTEGGAAYSLGELTLKNSSFEGNWGNSGGAIYFENILNVDNVQFTSNESRFEGGAINTYGNTVYKLTINDSTFTSNTAGTSGGALALFAKNAGDVVITDSRFIKNTATENNGGAISVIVASENGIGETDIYNLTINGKTTFDGNEAGWSGGAIYAIAYKQRTFNVNIGTAANSDITFSNNKGTDYYGGAIYLYGAEESINTFEIGTGEGAKASFTGNSAVDGGAMFIGATSTATVNPINIGSAVSGKVTFANNNATAGNGGAIYLGVQNPVLNLYAGFDQNTAHGDGGAVYLSGDAVTLYVGGKSEFTNNKALNGNGGAVMFSDSDGVKNVTIGDGSASTVKFENNTAAQSGGAIYIAGGGEINMTVSTNGGSAEFLKNRAVNGRGGAIFVQSYWNNVNLGITGKFEGNTAATDGGAIFAETWWSSDLALDITVNAGSVFKDNTAGNSGAAMFLSSVGDNGKIKADISGKFENNTATNWRGGVVFGEAKGVIDFTVGANSEFTGNTANAEGGALYLVGENTLTLTVKEGASFSSNKANDGGAIYARNQYATEQLHIGEDGGKDVTFDGNGALSGDGGAIWLWGDLTTYNTVFTSNTASRNGGAVYSQYGSVSINDSRFGGATEDLGNAAGWYGGAIYLGNGFDKDSSISGTDFQNNKAEFEGGAVHMNGNANTLTVTGSNFTGNSAIMGGAIFNNGVTLAVIGGSFVNNAALYSGAGIRWAGCGAGIYNNSGTVSVKGVLFDGNDANQSGGAIFNYCGDLTVNGGEFYRNIAGGIGGAIYNSGDTDTFSTKASLTLEGNIIFGKENHGNEALSGGAILLSYSDVVVKDTGDIVFSYNKASQEGGAISLYESVMTLNSNVSFSNNEAYTDNSGTVYGSGGAIYSAYATLVVNGVIFTNNSAGGGGAIYSTSDGSSLTVNGGLFTNNQAKGMNGGGAIGVWGNNAYAEINNTRFENNTSVNNAGAINACGHVTVNGGSFINNSAIADGGAIWTGHHFTTDISLTLKGSIVFDENNADGSGGAIYAYRAAFSTGGATVDFLNNSAGADAGAVYIVAANFDGGSGTLNFTGNTAGRDAGALYVDSYTATGFTQSAVMNFKDNHADGDGGAIYTKFNMSLANVNFENNSAGNDGGTIYVSRNTLDLGAGNTFNGSSAGHDGGLIYVAGGAALNVNTDITFTNNSAGNSGGVLYLANGGTFSYSGALAFNSNRAGVDGGAIYSEIDLNLLSTSFSGNQALSGSGGAIYSQGDLTVTHSKFTGNTAKTDGGAVYVGGASANMDNTLIADNTASGNGGGIYFADAAVAAVLTNLTIANNTAAAGGGIYTNGGNVSVRNSILWGNKGNQYAGLDHTKVFNSGIEGWAYSDYATQGNVSLQSANSADGIGVSNLNNLNEYYVCFNSDYTLNSGSYLINRGDNANVSATDLGGADRIQLGIVDMGAYESAHKGNVVVDFGLLDDIMYGNASGNLSAGQDGYGSNNWNFSSSDTGYVAIVNGQAVAVKADGSVQIIADYLGDANWNARSSSSSVSTTKRSITVTGESDSRTYDGHYYDYSYIAGQIGQDGLANRFNDYIDSATVNSFRNAGSHDNIISNLVILNGNGEDMTGNYDITYEKGVVEIAQVRVTITGESGKHTYDGQYHDYSWSNQSGLLSGDDIYSVIGNNFRDAGTHSNIIDGAVILNANNENVTGNYDITYEKGVVEIAQVTLIITGESGNRTYDGQYHDYSYIPTNDLVTGDYIDSATVNSFRDAGTHTNLQSSVLIKNAAGEDMTGNYSIDYVAGTVEIAQVTLIITGESDSRTYDGQYHDYSHKPVDLATGDSIYSIDGENSWRNAGSYTNLQSSAIITNANGEDMTGNYSIDYVAGTVEIAQVTLIITGESDSRTYDGQYHDYSHKPVDLATGDSIYSIKGENSWRNAGSYTNLQSSAIITNANGEDMTGNYDITYEKGVVVIGQADLTIVIDSHGKMVGDADPVFTGTGHGLAGGDTVNGFDRTDKGETVGQYVIDQYTLSDGNGGENYNIVTVVNGTLTITAPTPSEAPINIYSDASSRNYVINGMDQATLITNVSAMTANRDADAVLDTETSGNVNSVSHQTSTRAGEKAKSNLRDDSQKKSFEEIDQEAAQQKSNSLLTRSDSLSRGEKTSIVESQYKSGDKTGGTRVQVPTSEFSASQNTSFVSDHPMHNMPSNINIDASGVNVVNFSSMDLADVTVIEKAENFKDALDLLLEELVTV